MESEITGKQQSTRVVTHMAQSDPEMLQWHDTASSSSSQSDTTTTNSTKRWKRVEKQSAEYDIFGHRASGRINEGSLNLFSWSANHEQTKTRKHDPTYDGTFTINGTSGAPEKRRGKHHNPCSANEDAGDIIGHVDTEHWKGKKKEHTITFGIIIKKKTQL
eukprot:TRINITY_DN2516_c0_g1_i2.p1 TRINITY_DN2516_c0_g1~~TRINITY_DN2516_c0_g1_i2.p1  ORF type:complete len:161 (-),score=42.38 TRINITY_DN2516_c0_g1_i2:84-566(-)